MGRLPLDAEEDFRNPHRLPGVYRSERQSLRWTAVCATFFGEEIELSDAAGNPSPLPSPSGEGRGEGRGEGTTSTWVGNHRPSIQELTLKIGSGSASGPR